MKRTIAIAGAGILGRMLALAFHRKNWQVTLYDRDSREGTRSGSWSGTGMCAPCCGLETEERIVSNLGAYAMEQWPLWLESLPRPVYHRQEGCLTVAHPLDAAELGRLRRRVMESAMRDDAMEELEQPDIATLEPELAGRFNHALYFPLEQHLDTRDLMQALRAAIEEAGIAWHDRTEVTALAPHAIQTADGSASYDWVVDARGPGAQADLPGLRRVCGELVYLEAPGVNLRRPVRLMHPRHPIYIVPRARHVYVVGATAIEDEGGHGITVRSALDLLSAACTVHPAFAGARVIETAVQGLATYHDHLPRIIPQQGLVAINGLYRHGILMAPALADIVLDFIHTGEVHPMADGVMEDWTL